MLMLQLMAAGDDCRRLATALPSICGVIIVTFL